MVNLIKLKSNDDVIINNEIVNYKVPSKIYLPLDESVSIKENQYVYKDIRIGKNVSSVSGYINSIRKTKMNGKVVNIVEIANDYKECTKNSKKKSKINNFDEFLSFLSNNYLDKIKEKFTKVSHAYNLVVSSIDEECSQNEFTRLSHNYEEISETIDFLKNVLNIKQSYLVIKNTDYKSIKSVKKIIGTYLDIMVTLVPNKYLISKSHFLCEFLNLNEDDTVVLSTSDIYNIYLFKNAKDTSLKYISIYGSGLKNGVVVSAKLYCRVSEMLNDLGIAYKGNFDIYINGELGGRKVDNLDEIVVTEELDSIVINNHKDYEETMCINCGICKKVCPFEINVKRCYFDNVSNQKCIGCGLCSYYCPAKLHLKEKAFGDNYEE